MTTTLIRRVGMEEGCTEEDAVADLGGEAGVRQLPVDRAMVDKVAFDGRVCSSHGRAGVRTCGGDICSEPRGTSEG